MVVYRSIEKCKYLRKETDIMTRLTVKKMKNDYPVVVSVSA